MPVKPIPEGYHSVTPYMIVNNGAAALAFYKRAFGAEELFRMDGPGGKIGHAEFRIGDSPIMLADEHPEMGAKSPASYGGSPVGLMIYVSNVDEVFARAVEAGGTVVWPLKNQFYGDRAGTIKDPFGHQWTIATHVEDVQPDDLARRAKESGKCA